MYLFNIIKEFIEVWYPPEKLDNFEQYNNVLAYGLTTLIVALFVRKILKIVGILK